MSLCKPDHKRPNPRPSESRLHDWISDLLAASARKGPVPQHIGFTPDGNRRWGRQRGLSIQDAYLRGWDKMGSITEFCLKCGVRVVSLFLFSIKNYKRPKEEISVFEQVFKQRLDTFEQLGRRFNVQVRLVGERNLICPDLLSCIDDVVERTKDNSQGFINIYYAYTSTTEMTTSIKATVQERLSGCEAVPKSADGQSIETTTTLDLLDKHMYTCDDPPLDILVRTGNAYRLSDFLLWQCHQNTSLVYLEKFWPDMSAFRMMMIALEWRLKQSRQLME